MKKIVDFGISEASKIDRLDAGWDKLDFENGRGEYITIIRIEDRHYIITRGQDKRNKDKIQVNEISFDSYNDGSLVFYYNTHKDRACMMLEEKLNSPEVQEIGLERLIDRIGSYSHLKKIFENTFHNSVEYIYPEGYFEREGSYLEGSTDDKLESIPIQQVIVTGLSRDIFEELHRTKIHYERSYYFTIMHNAELQRQVDELRKQNEMLQRELRQRDSGFHM